MSARPGSERYSEGAGSVVDDGLGSVADRGGCPELGGGAAEPRAERDTGRDSPVLDAEFCHADDYEDADKNSGEDGGNPEGDARDVPDSLESTAESGGGGSNKVSSEAGDGDGYSSDDTSELSEGEKLAFEMRRAEIRRGKARESSPAPSMRASGETLIAAVPEPQLVGHEGDVLAGAEPGGVRDELLLPMAGPATQDLEDPDVVYIPWERDPERPLQKLPIRLRDLNGRTFLLPWEKVKTWKVSLTAANTESEAKANRRSQRAKAMIRRIHGYNERLLDLIDDGEYHLVAKNVWANQDDAAVEPHLTSYPHANAKPSSPESSPIPGPSSGNVPPGPYANNPMSGGRNRIPHTRDAIILPELWELVAEPGMYIDVAVWHGGSHPVFGQVPPQHAGRGRGWMPLGAGMAVMPPGQGRGFNVPPPPPPPHQAHQGRGGPVEIVDVEVMGMGRGGGGPRPGGRSWAVSVAPRRVVKTRVRQKR